MFSSWLDSFIIVSKCALVVKSAAPCVGWAWHPPHNLELEVQACWFWNTSKTHARGSYDEIIQKFWTFKDGCPCQKRSQDLERIRRFDGYRRLAPLNQHRVTFNSNGFKIRANGTTKVASTTVDSAEHGFSSMLLLRTTHNTHAFSSVTRYTCYGWIVTLFTLKKESACGSEWCHWCWPLPRGRTR